MQKFYLFILFQESGERSIKESSGGGEFKYDENLCKCHNVPPTSITIQKKKKKKKELLKSKQEKNQKFHWINKQKHIRKL
jgi:hypothetical protein